MKRSSLLIILSMLALAVFLRIPFLAHEFVLEEGLHVKISRNILETGSPIVYLDELQGSINPYFRPPGLFLLLVPSLAIFGENEASARLTPMLFGLAEIFITLFFGLKLFGKKSPLTGYLAGLLMAIHPYLIQTSLQIHYDQIYSFFSTLFLFLSLEKILKRKNTFIDFVQIGVAFFLAFSIKYDPTLILLAITSLFAFFYNRKFLYKLFVTITLSVITFFTLFYFYSARLGNAQDFWQPFTLIWKVLKAKFFTKLTTFNANEARPIWAESYYLLIRFLSWLSIPVILSAFYSLVRLVKTKKFKDPKIVFLALWLSIYVLAYLAVGWAGDYPRYFAPIMPALFLLLGKIITEDFRKYGKKYSFLIVILTSLLTSLLLYLFYIKNYLFLDHITGWIPSLQMPFFAILFSGVFIIFLILRSNLHSYLPAILIFFALGQIVIQYVHDLKSNYSLTNFYGTSGAKDAAFYLKKNLDPDKIIFTYDPVAYYWNNRYYDYVNSTNGLFLPDKNLIDILTSDAISAFALPKPYYDELARISRNYNFDFYNFLSTNYRSYKKFGENTPTEVYYR